jgi:lysophospholipase L1-like esterase
MISIRTGLVISLAVNVLAVALLGILIRKMGGVEYLKAKFYEQTDGSPYSDPSAPFHESPGYRQAVSIHNVAPVEAGDVVFLGDSHAANGQWSEFFGSARVRNRGISGDNTLGVLNRLEGALSGPPSAVFLFIGSNDVDQRYNGVPVDEAVSRVERILEKIAATAPDASVYLMSAPPKSRNTTVNVTETPLAHELNAHFAVIAPEHGATFVDLSEALHDSGGSLRVAFTEDGGHLNGAGYDAIVGEIRPLVNDALGRALPVELQP